MSSSTNSAQEAPPKESQMTRYIDHFNLNDHTARLLLEEPFFAALSRRINKVSTKGIPTAGVRINPNTAQFELFYNPDFFCYLTNKQRLAVLKHEYYHLIFEHVTGRKPSDKNLHKVWNIATDLAINSYLMDELPDFCCFPERGIFKDLPKEKAAEWYFNVLKNQKEFIEKHFPDSKMYGAGAGSGKDQQFDNHSEWIENDEASREIREIAKEKLREIARKSAQEANEANSWGSVPQSCRDNILKWLAGRVDWKKVLRYFIKMSQKANKSSSIRKLNKRYPYIHAGKKSNRCARLAISVDQSGSVSDELLSKFFSELNGLSHLAEFVVIPFDTEVATDAVFVWKKGEKRKGQRVRCGGTDFDAPTRYVNERSFDGHIVLTDLCAPKPIPSKCQRIWMTSQEHGTNPYFQTNERIVIVD